MTQVAVDSSDRPQVNWILAYLDAGSGALLLQMLIGGAAGVAAFVRFRWKRLTGRIPPLVNDQTEAVTDKVDLSEA